MGSSMFVPVVFCMWMIVVLAVTVAGVHAAAAAAAAAGLAGTSWLSGAAAPSAAYVATSHAHAPDQQLVQCSWQSSWGCTASQGRTGRDTRESCQW